MNTDNLDYYLSLTKLTYSNAVNLLLRKYGSVSDDYYREKSYIRFLNNEIKTITKGKYSKGKEGLYTHHIQENICENLSVLSYIKFYNPPYEYQKRKNLVYADLFEHLILHALIAKETNGNFGFNGYQSYLKPIVKEWYIDHKIPKPEWMQTCYERAYLSKQETQTIISVVEKEVINRVLYKKSLEPVIMSEIREITTYELPYDLLKDKYQSFFYRRVNIKDEAIFNAAIESILDEITSWNSVLIKENLTALLKKRLKPFLISDDEFQKMKNEIAAKEKQWEEWRQREIQKEKDRIERWKDKHPYLIENGYFENTPRRKVLRRMYDDKYINDFKTFKEFRSSKNSNLIEELLEELEQILSKQHSQ